jgi:hypothetical protein
MGGVLSPHPVIRAPFLLLQTVDLSRMPGTRRPKPLSRAAAKIESCIEDAQRSCGAGPRLIAFVRGIIQGSDCQFGQAPRQTVSVRMGDEQFYDFFAELIIV